MYKDFMKTVRENLMEEITYMAECMLNPYGGTINFIDAVECTTFQDTNTYEEVSIYGLYISHGEGCETEISVTVENNEYSIEEMNTYDLAAICDELKFGKIEVIGDRDETPVPNKLYVVYDNTVIDGDASCTECIGIFTTLEKARTALKNRAETYAEDEERWSEYGDVDTWSKTEDKYEIWDGVGYVMNHICITVEEANIDDKLFLNN